MSWVSIDEEKCNGCGICATRCVRVFTNKDGVISANANEETCNLCGHCMALCPTDGISHSLMDMDNFIPIEARAAIEPDEFIALVKQRRSHRSYKDKAIPKEDLEQLVQMCRYIPTGSNMQTVEIQVITNGEKIKKLSDLTIDYFMDMIAGVEKQVKDVKSRGEELPKELAGMSEFANRYKMLGLARDFGIDPILHKSPAVMIFHSGQNPSTPKDDCVIAAQTVVLAAEAMGLGTCYIGLLNFSASSSPKVKETLNLPGENKAYCVLVMGYPKLKFLKTVDRKPLKVTWEE
jgi:nitroreductase/NAD-dependent dihydropyrimidine dehydrogenase PreA subunit